MGVIIKPIVTEKMTKMAGDKNSRFAFYVDKTANKLEIKSEVEALYNVTVVDVNTLNTSVKKKSRYTKSGVINGAKPSMKKAIVTLKDGDAIDFYSNI
ncbi:MAG: 50S ribosomal protein L23 [Paludibacteraceae bacterium]|nr:50S ribosomal protein L23 [Paludibacteraceae bacterium]